MSIGDKEIPLAKFFNGQVVTTNSNHFSQHEVIILIDPRYNGDEWYYGNKYCKYENGRIVVGGGMSYAWKEKDFSEITDPVIRVACDIFYKENERVHILSKLKENESELAKLHTVKDYLLSIKQLDKETK